MNTSTTVAGMDLDEHLSHLLGTMRLSGSTWNATKDVANEEPCTALPTSKPRDIAMSDSSDTEDLTYQTSPSDSSKRNGDERPPCGCALLQAMHGQMLSDRYPTTSGDYLESIFTHREVFFAFPQGHRECAVGFTDLASYLEHREWRSDREGDLEAVAAFRHEAWLIANTW